jgi:hypothetical protein
MDGMENTVPLLQYKLLLSDGMPYSTVACTAISMNGTENTITLFLFMGHCQAKVSCFIPQFLL